jgi:hypothetical protein
MVPLLFVGAVANGVAYGLSRWVVFGVLAGGCAVAGAAVAVLERAVLGLDCCPHDDDAPTEPIPVVVPPCQGCNSPLCVDCCPEWEVVRW